MKKFIFSAFLLLSFSLNADKVALPGIEAPWFTGPLIAPTAFTVPAGHYNIEPYIITFPRTALYDKNWTPHEIPTFWNNQQETLIAIGLNSWMDIEFLPSWFFNSVNGVSSWGFGDFPILLDFQLYKNDDDITGWVTALKLTLGEIFPIGKYQNLNPHRLGTDAIGAGSWQSIVALVWSNMFYLGGKSFLNTRWFVQYTIPAAVQVKNLNAYGGGDGTLGKIYPAQNLQIDFAFELSLSKNWAISNDLFAVWNGNTRFKGISTGPIAPPSSFQLSLAPAIEYNWSANIGLIFGPWFTIIGRNAPSFTGGAIAFNYYK